MTNKPIADLTPRVMGGLIDVIIIMIAAVVLMWIWGFISGASGEHAYLSSQQIDDIWRGRGMLAYLIIDVIYTVGLQASSGGATFGQKSMGLRLVTVKYENPTLGALILRYFMSLISSIFLKIGFLIALFSDKKQTLHDMVSGTIVVREGSDLQKSMSPKSNFDSKPYANTAQTASPSIKIPSPLASDNALSQAPENDEIYYERAMEEFESNKRKGLWIKLLTQNEGDEVKSKFQYIKTRAQEIQTEDADLKVKNQTNLNTVKGEEPLNDAQDLNKGKVDQKIKPTLYQNIGLTQSKRNPSSSAQTESGGFYENQRISSYESQKDNFSIKFKFDYQHRSVLYLAAQTYILANDKNAYDACISTCTVMNRNELFDFVEHLLSIPIKNIAASTDQRRRSFIEQVDGFMHGRQPSLTTNHNNVWMDAIASKNIDLANELFRSSIINSA
jgi:uncharacterized RDD family membrane protein YckC